MNTPRFSTISKLSLIAMLMLFSMAMFVIPVANEAQGQAASRVRDICFNNKTGVATTLNKNGGCESGSDKTRVSSTPNGVCVADFKPGFEILDPSKDTGNYYFSGGKCYQADPAVPGNVAGVFTAFDSMKPSGPSTTPIITPTSGGGSGTKPTSKPTNTGGGSGGSTSNQAPCDPPEDGFHKAGPLCVPNNPFSDSSIAGGNQTAASLAVRIIKILLYFAAIVAVIMIIVGGYYVMTAAGNAEQASKGRKTLTNAIIGLVIVILAYVIVQAVVTFITK